jgi:hypothetical protein
MESLRPNLRDRLLDQLNNVELRQKYLATRTPEWASLDRLRAWKGLLLARLTRGIAGFALLGAAGGGIADLVVGSSAAPGGTVMVAAVGLGSAVACSISFALLAAAGCVVLPELVGESKESRTGRGVRAQLGRVLDTLLEAGCGAMWGGICGLLIGVLAWVANGLVQVAGAAPLARIPAGAAGGAILAGLFAMFLFTGVGRQMTAAAAFRWGELGPVPLLAYGFSWRRAPQRCLPDSRRGEPDLS